MPVVRIVRLSVSLTLRLMISASDVAAVLAPVLADPVRDDHGVVHREADDRQQGGDDREVELVAERRPGSRPSMMTSCSSAITAPMP